MTDTEFDLDKDKSVVRRKKDGVDAYGLYVDAIVANSDGKLEYQVRYFLAMNVLCVYNRKAGFKRASWQPTTYGSHDEARKELLQAMAHLPASRTVMLSHPLLVELYNSDVESLKVGNAPSARFLGTTSMERITGGEIDDSTWVLPSAS